MVISKSKYMAGAAGVDRRLQHSSQPKTGGLGPAVAAGPLRLTRESLRRLPHSYAYGNMTS